MDDRGHSLAHKFVQYTFFFLFFLKGKKLGGGKSSDLKQKNPPTGGVDRISDLPASTSHTVIMDTALPGCWISHPQLPCVILTVSFPFTDVSTAAASMSHILHTVCHHI